MVNDNESEIIERIKGDDWYITFRNVDVSNIDKAWFTCKSQVSHTDTQAKLQVEYTQGLLRLNGAAGTPAHAEMTLGDNSITVHVKNAATNLLSTATLHFDLQIKQLSGVIYTPKMGYLKISQDITQST